MPTPLPRRRRALVLALLALPLLGPAAGAADLGYPPYPGPGYGAGPEPYDPGPPPPPPPPRPRFSAGPPIGPAFGPPPEICRTIVRRRLDEDGEPVVRRIRICEAPDAPRPRFRPSFAHSPLPPGEIPEGPWGGPPPRW